MLTAANFWLLIKALISVTPWLIQLIQEGKIRAASQEEIVNAIQDGIASRVADALAAKHDDSLPDPYAKRK